MCHTHPVDRSGASKEFRDGPCGADRLAALDALRHLPTGQTPSQLTSYLQAKGFSGPSHPARHLNGVRSDRHSSALRQLATQGSPQADLALVRQLTQAALHSNMTFEDQARALASVDATLLNLYQSKGSTPELFEAFTAVANAAQRLPKTCRGTVVARLRDRIRNLNTPDLLTAKRLLDAVSEAP
jgi:hypothetical protein